MGNSGLRDLTVEELSERAHQAQKIIEDINAEMRRRDNLKKKEYAVTLMELLKKIIENDYIISLSVPDSDIVIDNSNIREVVMEVFK